MLLLIIGLKKVTNDMKTYKNPELRASSVVKASDTAKKPTATPKSAAPAVKKPPVCELQGQKWIVVRVYWVVLSIPSAYYTFSIALCSHMCLAQITFL